MKGLVYPMIMYGKSRLFRFHHFISMIFLFTTWCFLNLEESYLVKKTFSVPLNPGF